VQVVIEAKSVGAQGVIKRLFAGMTEGRMPNVVHQRERFGQIGVQPKSRRHGARDLRDFKCMGKATAKVVAGHFAGRACKHLRFSSQAPERACVQNAGAIASKRSTVGVKSLRMHTPREFTVCGAAHRNSRRQSCRGFGFVVHRPAGAIILKSGYIAAERFAIAPRVTS